VTALRRHAFTLLEVLLAMSILALVTVGILMTFRTAARTYERSDGLMISLQATRAVSDSVGRDIRATFTLIWRSMGSSSARTSRSLPRPRWVHRS